MPFRFFYQLTDVDCFPSSTLNALGHLFPRRAIPGAVVQRIWMYSMDGVADGIDTGRFTSEDAAKLVGSWLPTYRTRHFGVRTRYVAGSDVNMTPTGTLVQALHQGAVAVLDVMGSGGITHSVVALEADEDWVYIWDPYHTRVNPRATPHIERCDESGLGPNIRVRRTHLSRTTLRKFTLGPLPQRAALLIWRVPRRPGAE